MYKKYNQIFRTYSYLRLSVEDGDRVESDSIKNQRVIVNRYKDGHPEIHLVGEKVDDGYTGTNFNRPGFKELLELIKKGLVDCIIVKDLSRLGRDFTEVLRYVQRRFPEWGIRFIAIDDNYDSEDESCQQDFLTLPIKSLLNESYPANTSINIRNTLKAMREQGLFVGAFTHYGYLKDPEDYHQLILDPVASDVVRDIFLWKLCGMSQDAIAARLDSLGILTPSDYKVSKGIQYKTTFKKYERSHWTAVAVGRILRDITYVGILIQGKTTTPNFKVKKIIHKEQDDWDIVEGAIPPIVSWIDFMIVNHLLERDTRTAPGQDTVYLFSGLLECGDCHQSLVRKSVKYNEKEYGYYVCSTNRGNKKECSPHRVAETKLKKSLLLLIQHHISVMAELKSILSYVETIPFSDRKVEKESNRMEMLKKEYQWNLKLSTSLYESFQEEILTKEEYLQMKKKYSERCTELEKLMECQQEESRNIFRNICGKNNWIDHFLKFGKIEDLDRRLVVSLIKSIQVTAQGNLEITFWFEDEYRQTLDRIKQIHSELPNPKMQSFLKKLGEGGVLCG
ncbi:TPA: recombinase family protein [Clostridioides difficile]|uniref:recombinase family protein n=1 Tax=Clostridioides difficile TaxID=1496 RepID=UPI00038D451E|nr:recombinase family protein [Clostridioides difficile]EGT4625338.1 recombinase TnpX [Clostridioides difficile]ELX4576129.1 recombinase family protein [Clostridioides difficile]EQK76196.1 recombinase family protein [Clostridioides difficile CD113]MBH6986726.1 recombinase family protein [Clostridioides difficile]MBH7139354.1 recombinase family protein [Clostridioides difficile]